MDRPTIKEDRSAVIISSSSSYTLGTGATKFKEGDSLGGRTFCRFFHVFDKFTDSSGFTDDYIMLVRSVCHKKGVCSVVVVVVMVLEFVAEAICSKAGV